MSAAEKAPKDADRRLQLRADKRLGVFEFRCDVDLPLDGVTALFGASGAGKSTLDRVARGAAAAGPRAHRPRVADAF